MKNKIPDDMIAGTIHKTKTSGSLKIIKYNGCFDVIFEFAETGYSSVAQSSNIRLGSVKDPLHKSVYGIAFLGVGKYKSSINNKETIVYKTWNGMLKRCYHAQTQDRQPTYKGCTVCEEWFNFQNFADWYYKNYIDGYHLDKDIRLKGNKIYSPDTCMFVSLKDNNIAARAKHFKVKNPDGDTVEIYNLREFCRANDLGPGNMWSVISGRRRHHKNWTKA